MDFAMHSGAYYPKPQSRRTATLPSPLPPRPSSPQPTSAPPVPQPNARLSSAKKSSLDARRPMPQESMSNLSHRNPGGLEQEITRLMAACEEHERKIRATKNSIEHRLFSDIPNILTRLNDIDDAADATTTKLYTSIQSAHPALQSKLSAITFARQQDVETMRQRTTPWKTFFEEKDEIHGETQKGTGRIARIGGAGMGDDGTALATMERWAEEVEMYLTSEIIRLKATLSDKSRRRNIIFRGIVSLTIGIPLLFVVLIVVSHFLEG